MTKSEIVQAAFKAWGGDFYRATSLSTLAEALGVTKTALYHHFKNKDGILDAMYNTFFDSFSGYVRPVFEKSLAAAETGAAKNEILDALLLVNHSTTEFFVRNPWHLMFSLVKIYGKTDTWQENDALSERGLDFTKLQYISNSLTGENIYPPLFQLVNAGTICIVGYFMRSLRMEPFSEEHISTIMRQVDGFVRRGIGLNRDRIDALDWQTLEKNALWRESGGGGGRRKWLLKAVASVVAAAGPWAASMSMVAKKSGLSKSGLYAHFASKHDMLRQLFLEEFNDVILHAHNVSRKSGVPEEQLYLVLRAVEGFLTSEPEFLAAINSLKTRRIGFEGAGFDSISFDDDMLNRVHKDKLECRSSLLRVFSEIKTASGEMLVDEITTTLILFLLTDTLVRKPASTPYKDMPDESFRTLYRFIALGTEGLCCER
ncbi:MAG: TetR/AcrR family transcriptional regulator [Spirochaetaceae bacterium]|jgi:AcrR family transcriptional regulator|nr:TetR/AcrR family transcriptional regulator [Spirochaetaceae bacterium]